MFYRNVHVFCHRYLDVLPQLQSWSHQSLPAGLWIFQKLAFFLPFLALFKCRHLSDTDSRVALTILDLLWCVSLQMAKNSSGHNDSLPSPQTVFFSPCICTILPFLLAKWRMECSPFPACPDNGAGTKGQIWDSEWNGFCKSPQIFKYIDLFWFIWINQAALSAATSTACTYIKHELRSLSIHTSTVVVGSQKCPVCTSV